MAEVIRETIEPRHWRSSKQRRTRRLAALVRSERRCRAEHRLSMIRPASARPRAFEFPTARAWAVSTRSRSGLCRADEGGDGSAP